MNYDTSTIIAFIIVASFCSTMLYVFFISVKNALVHLRYQLLTKEDVPKKTMQQAVRVNVNSNKQKRFERIFELPSYVRKDRCFYFPMNINDLKGK